MKKLFLILILTAGITASAQGPFEGFWRPVDNHAFMLKARAGYGQWLFRPAAQMTAIQFTYDKEAKVFHSSTFSSAGIGIGYQHYVEANGQVINNYGLNALVVLDASQGSAGIGGAITVNALQFINAGVGYSITNKQFFIPVGAVYNF